MELSFILFAMGVTMAVATMEVSSFCFFKLFYYMTLLNLT